jgi:hypothetical protein
MGWKNELICLVHMKTYEFLGLETQARMDVLRLHGYFLDQ